MQHLHNNCCYCHRFPTLLPYGSPHDLSQLQEEYMDYQLMESDEISGDVWKAALLKDNSEEEVQYHRMDMIWASLASMISPDGRPRFSMLGNVAKLVLVLPGVRIRWNRSHGMERWNGIVEWNTGMPRPAGWALRMRT